MVTICHERKRLPAPRMTGQSLTVMTYPDVDDFHHTCVIYVLYLCSFAICDLVKTNNVNERLIPSDRMSLSRSDILDTSFWERMI